MRLGRDHVLRGLSFFTIKIMFSLEQIKKMILDGDMSPFYKDRAWRSLALKIIKDNHNECYMCKQQGRYTPAKLVHHIKPLRQAPQLAYDRDNLMPLCHDCHERIHKCGTYSERCGYRNAEKW